MHCSSCSKLIESTLNKNEFVKTAVVNFWNNKALVEYDEAKISENEIIALVDKAGYHASKEEEKQVDESEIWLKKSIFWFWLSLPLLAFMLYDFFPKMPFNNLLMPYMAIISLVIAGIVQFTLWLAFYKWTFAALSQKTANMYTLIAIWTTTAFLYSLYSYANFFLETWSILGLNGMKIEWIYFEVSALLITFVCFWKFLETRAKSKTNDAIWKLMSLAPKTAFVKVNKNHWKTSDFFVSQNNFSNTYDSVSLSQNILTSSNSSFLSDSWDYEYVEIEIEKINIWDIILVKPGDKIPVDGEIISWSASIDESMLTWESLPVDKNISDKVLAWTLNKFTSFEMKALKIWSWTMLSQIITLLEEASLSKADIEWFADKVSKIFVPTVIFLSILTFVVWYFILNWTFENALLLACSVIVIACPCALWLATPTAVIVWTWIAAKFWILVKWWSALEKASFINAIALDKTWTITTWNPSLVDIIITSADSNWKWIFSENELLQIAYSLENNSNHPISKAIVNYSKEKNISLIETKNFEIINWKWIIWEVNLKKYFIWNLALIKEKNISLSKTINKDYEHLLIEWKTVIFLANETEVLAIFWVSDTVKATSKDAINILKNMWVEVFMITWDNKNSASFIARQVWIKEENIFSEVLPQDKWNIIKEIQKKWFKVAMVWDGINDSIAMANSDLAISMWNWNDVALESSDIVLMKNDLHDIITSISISQKTLSKIKQNLFFSLFYNSLWIPVAAWVFLSFWLFLKPELAGLAMALSSFSVVINSLLLKVRLKYFSFISITLLILVFTSIFVSFASLNKTDKFEKSYTLNNERVLTSITEFITTSKNKINITETPAPKIFLFNDKLPENIKLKSWVNSLNEWEMIIWYMEAQMMIKEWLIDWVWSELNNFFWIPKVKVVWILTKTDTAIDDVHILNSIHYENLLWDNESLKYFATPDKLAIRTFYLFDETNIPTFFKNEINDDSFIDWDYLRMYVWFTDANMMVDLWLVEGIWEKLDDFFGNKVIYYKKLRKNYSAYDMMHFLPKKYFKFQ